MNDKNNLYLGALLHDIGKFIERAKDDFWRTEANKYVQNKEASDNYAHRRYSAAFVSKYKNKKDFLSDSIESLVLHHHNDNPALVENYLSIDQRGILQKIIRIADDLASAERSEDDTLEPGKYYKANLEIPFNDIRITLKGDYSSKELILDKKYYYQKSIRELDVRNAVGTNILGMRRKDGTYLVNPNADTLINEGDAIFVLGTQDQIVTLKKLLQK
jgi:CRISPR/Cas system-associated protein Cas10 (large subunit of type III CRISPR-Cas system)